MNVVDVFHMGKVVHPFYSTRHALHTYTARSHYRPHHFPQLLFHLNIP